MGDVEDPEIYAAQPLYEWQQTTKGQWVMKHCPDPRYSVKMDPAMYGYKIEIWGNLEDKLAVEYLLKWKNEQS